MDRRLLAAFADGGRHTCIRVQQGNKYTRFIPMDASGLRVDKAMHHEFSHRFRVRLDTPVERAAEQFLATKHIPMTEMAVGILQRIIKLGAEDVKYHIIAINGKHLSVADNLTDMEAAVKLHGEKKTVGIRTAQELSGLTAEALKKLHNQFAEKKIKARMDNDPATLDMVFKLLPSLESTVVVDVPEAADAEDESVADAEDESVVDDVQAEKPQRQRRRGKSFADLQVEHTQATAVGATKKEVEMARAKKAAKKVKKVSSRVMPKRNGAGPGEPNPESKIGKLLKRLKKGAATLDQLVEASGYDAPNTRTAIGLMRGGHVKGGPYAVTLDRASGKYSL